MTSKQIKIIEDSGYTYVCMAGVGTSISQDKWSVRRVSSNGDVIYPKNALGVPTDDYIFSPDDVTTLDYSYEY